MLGPIVSRERLDRGEQQTLIRELAQRDYIIPGSERCRLGEKTIEAWLYAWRKDGIQGLTSKERVDRGHSKITAPAQEAVLAAKRENPRRSVRQIVRLLEAAGVVASGTLSRSATHRLLQQHGLSRVIGSASLVDEKRSFNAEFAGSVWYGDVMHGPHVSVKGRLRKTYLVSLIDDASRLVAHSAFCLGETALDVEGVLKQAVLKRGLPSRLVVDNGAAYRSNTLQGICARLGITLIFCRPYRPEGKGKLERWHRSFRDLFLSELNARLWAWIEQVYHHTAHWGLGGITPLARYQRDLPRIRTLGTMAGQLDALFHHSIKRFVRKDGTVSYLGQRFEVPFELSGQTIKLVVDPHAQRVKGVEDEAGVWLGDATPLDCVANIKRKRRKPDTVTDIVVRQGPNLVEIAHAKYHGLSTDNDPIKKED